jgi:acetyl esterase/lipase
LTLSLYARTDPAERRPAVVFIHGGGWTGGDPYFHIRHANVLAAQGFVTATISYRLYPQAHWPQPLDDVKAAVRWVRAHADRIGADPHRIAVAGGSAGGHLAAWAALTSAADAAHPGMTAEEGVSSAVQAACLWYPAVDVNAMVFPPEAREGQDMIERFFGAPGAAGLADRRAASPIHAVHAAVPPILTMTGADDTLTPVAPIEEFHRLLTAAGVRNELRVFAGRDHAFDMVQPRDWQLCFDHLLAFLTAELATGAPTYDGAVAALTR